MGKANVASIYKDNLLDIYSPKLGLGDDAQLLAQFVYVPELKVELDVILPEEADANEAKRAGERFLPKFQEELGKHLAPAARELIRLYEADADGDKKAYKQAEGVLDKLNKNLEKLMEEFRIELRKAIAKALDNVKGKDLQTMGRSKFKELYFERGAFKNEISYDGDTDQLEAALKKKGWQHLGVVYLSEDGLLVITGKKKPRDSDFKKLIQTFGKNGAKKVSGMLSAAGAKNIKAQFLKSECEFGDAKGRKIILNALKEQLDIHAAVEVKIVSEYSDEDEAEETDATPEKKVATTKSGTAPKKKSEKPKKKKKGAKKGE